jgi:6-phosphogluconolactonase (cycloisomerase 2 family)
MGRHPSQCALVGFCGDGADGAKRDVLAGGGAQTGLNAADSSVALDQEGQDMTVEGGRDGGSRWQREEGSLQGLGAALHPGIERLARNAEVAAEVGDEAIVAGMGNHVADDLSALSGSAIMALNHSVPLKGGWMVTHRPYLSGSFCATLCVPDCQAVCQGSEPSLTANYATGHVTVARIQDDGSLGPVSAIVQHEGQSVHPQRQTGPHAHSITVDPSNRFVLVADLGLDAIMSYRFGQEAGTLTPNDPPALVLRPGAGPRHIAFHPNDRFAYVINELDSTIVACEYDATCGLLVPFQIESTLPSNFTGENTTAAIRVAPSGRFVYGSNRGHDSLASFAIDPESGRISFIEHVSTQGHTPRDCNIDPPGRFLLVANQESNTMVTLRIDQASGRLSPTGYVAEVLAPSCVAFGRWR